MPTMGMASAATSSPSPKPRRAIFVIVFVIPTSICAIAVMLIAGSGLRFVGHPAKPAFLWIFDAPPGSPHLFSVREKEIATPELDRHAKLPPLEVSSGDRFSAREKEMATSELDRHAKLPHLEVSNGDGFSAREKEIATPELDHHAMASDGNGFSRTNYSSTTPELESGGKIKSLQPSGRKRPSTSNPHLDLLQPNSRSKLYSTRAQEFFKSSSCNPRFFMTWISSPEALGLRELFSVESVFKTHQNACLLMVSDVMDSPAGNLLLKPLTERGYRVAALSPDFQHLFKNTPADHWFEDLVEGRIEPGRISIGQNISNLLRLAVLYKYGGAYIDTDVIVLKSFSGLKNVIGAQSLDAEIGDWTRLNNAVMVFDKGHPLLYGFIEEFTRSFNGNKWGHNGPYLVSRVVSKLKDVVPGLEYAVLPPPAFYPVDWNRIEGLFEGPKGGSHSKWVAAKLETIERESFALHLWNRRSRRIKAEEGSIVHRIITKYCILCNSSVF